MNVKTVVLSILFICISCESTSNKIPLPRTEKLDVYTVKEVNGEYVKDKIAFSESFIYDEERKMDHFILDDKGNIINREKLKYNDQNQLIRSDFYNMFDSLLSYYSYEYPTKDMQLKKSYDAANDEMLRIEKIYFDQNKNIKKKELCNSDDQLQKTYNFKYDSDGNESYFSIFNANGQRLRSEEYNITKYDPYKRWLEKWGFQHDKPVSFKQRTFGYPK